MKNASSQKNVANLTPGDLLRALAVLSLREAARQARLSSISRLRGAA